MTYPLLPGEMRHCLNRCSYEERWGNDVSYHDGGFRRRKIRTAAQKMKIIRLATRASLKQQGYACMRL